MRMIGQEKKHDNIKKVFLLQELYQVMLYPHTTPIYQLKLLGPCWIRGYTFLYMSHWPVLTSIVFCLLLNAFDVRK